MKINILWEKNDRIALALSGGVDSVVLFHLLTGDYKDSYKELLIFHINHGLREESDSEAIFVENLAKKNNLKFYKKELKLKNKLKESHVSEEMLARKLRYQAFADFAKKENIKKIITAHHHNDCVENILLRLFSGRGIDYQLSIEEKTTINNLTVLRPLLTIPKSRLENYATSNNINFYQDISNFDTDYNRNYVRHKIVPLLSNINKRAENSITDFANYYNEVNCLAKDYTLKKIKNFPIKVSDEELRIPLEDFNSLKQIEKYFFISNILNEKFNIFDVSKKSIMTAINNLTAANSNISLDLKENIKLIKEYQSISICNFKKKCYNDKIEISAEDIYNGFSCNFGEYKIIVTTENKDSELAFSQADLPLLIATKKAGDSIKRGNITKKIARIFIDEKIPKNLREKLPVVRNATGEIIGVLGIGSKANKKTENAYYLKLLKG